MVVTNMVITRKLVYFHENIWRFHWIVKIPIWYCFWYGMNSLMLEAGVHTFPTYSCYRFTIIVVYNKRLLVMYEITYQSSLILYVKGGINPCLHWYTNCQFPLAPNWIQLCQAMRNSKQVYFHDSSENVCKAVQSCSLTIQMCGIAHTREDVAYDLK